MSKFSQLAIVYICVFALVFTNTMPAYAGIVGTNEILQLQYTDLKRANLYKIIDRADARNLLEQHGVTAEQAHERINSLTDEEVRMLAQKFEDLPAAGSISGAAAILILVLLIIILVLR
ncbi:MAG: PA2779 family protein [Gammaproteobacteria bacterium]|nr:PA2779 family protein [Gammaproteobacteria bacterium]